MHSVSCKIIASSSRVSWHPFSEVFLHLNRIVFSFKNSWITLLGSVEMRLLHLHFFGSFNLQSWQIWCCDEHWNHWDFPAFGPLSQMWHFNCSYRIWLVSFDAILVFETSSNDFSRISQDFSRNWDNTRNINKLRWKSRNLSRPEGVRKISWKLSFILRFSSTENDVIFSFKNNFDKKVSKIQSNRKNCEIGWMANLF